MNHGPLRDGAGLPAPMADLRLADRRAVDGRLVVVCASRDASGPPGAVFESPDAGLLLETVPTIVTATRATVSYPADLSGWGRDQLETPWFRAYLRKRLAETEVGEAVEAFLDVGCCGDTLDVPLRLEGIEGDRRVDESTTIEYVEREACGLDGGWLVQSRAAPSKRE